LYKYRVLGRYGKESIIYIINLNQYWPIMLRKLSLTLL
jgi:hypothetical protein